MADDHGYIVISRKMFSGDDLFWKVRRVYSMAEAWIDLIAEASWRPRSMMVKDVRVELDRGELLGSLRFLGQRWGWGKNKVSRFLGLLKNEKRISLKTDHEAGHLGPIVKITNYDTYQRKPFESGTENGTVSGQRRDSLGTAAGQREYSKGSKEQENIGPPDSGLLFDLGGSPPPDPLPEIWEAFLTAKRRCCEICGAQYRESKLSPSLHSHLAGIMAKLTREFGPEEALRMMREAPLGLELSDWHMARGRYVGGMTRLDWRDVFNVTGKVNQVEILSNLYARSKAGHRNNGNRPATQDIELQRTVLVTDLVGHRQDRGEEWYSRVSKAAFDAKTAEQLEAIRARELGEPLP